MFALLVRPTKHKSLIFIKRGIASVDVTVDVAVLTAKITRVNARS